MEAYSSRHADWQSAVIIDHKEAARRALCHPDTLRKMMADGEAPGTKVGRRWIVSEEVFQEWIDKRCRSTDETTLRIGGSGLAERLANQRALRIELKRKSMSASYANRSGVSKISATVVQFSGRKPQNAG